MDPKIVVKDLNFYYGNFHALKNISIEIGERKVTAFIGPSGCGKSTFLRTLNRMNDLIPDTKLTGKVFLDGKNIYDEDVDVVEVRRRVGMIFQVPNPFPKSIFENVAFGLRILGVNSKSVLKEKVERSLRAAALWDEVKDRLNDSAL